MPNHFHLLLRQKKDGGIARFMQKLGTGYTMSFNKKHKRVGHLFQGAFKAILVDKQNHFLNLPYYVHLNPLDLKFPEWRVRKLDDHTKAVEFLNNYRWSSHLDYLGKKNFPSITNREFLLNVFGGQDKYRQNIDKWLGDLESRGVRDIALE